MTYFAQQADKATANGANKRVVETLVRRLESLEFTSKQGTARFQANLERQRMMDKLDRLTKPQPTLTASEDVKLLPETTTALDPDKFAPITLDI